ncbi:HTH-type transcriptional regulator MhqR [compost metagenome]
MELNQSIGYLISNTGRKLNQVLQKLFHETDVTPEQWSLLLCLEQRDGISHKELARRTGKDPANITRLLDQLERKKHVRRSFNPSDRRSQLLYITESGKSLARELVPVEAAFVSTLLTGITDEEVERFRAFMTKVNQNADQYL